MAKHLDVREVAENMFARAKEILQKHGDPSPRGYVLGAGTVAGGNGIFIHSNSRSITVLTQAQCSLLA